MLQVSTANKLYVLLCLQELPAVAKLFVQSVKGPACGHANDFDFRLCQRGGYKRKSVTTTRNDRINVAVDIEEIEARLQQLFNYDQATSYRFRTLNPNPNPDS